MNSRRNAYPKKRLEQSASESKGHQQEKRCERWTGSGVMRVERTFKVMRSTETGRRLCGRREKTRTAQIGHLMRRRGIRVLYNSVGRLRGHCVRGLELHSTDKVSIAFRNMQYRHLRCMGLGDSSFLERITVMRGGASVCAWRRAETEGVLQRLLLYSDILCNSKWHGSWRQMSGEGAKGMGQNAVTAANSLPKSFDRAHAPRPRSVTNAAPTFPGKARLQPFLLHPHRSSSGERDLGIGNGFHLFAR